MAKKLLVAVLNPADAFLAVQSEIEFLSSVSLISD